MCTQEIALGHQSVRGIIQRVGCKKKFAQSHPFIPSIEHESATKKTQCGYNFIMFLWLLNEMNLFGMMRRGGSQDQTRLLLFPDTAGAGTAADDDDEEKEFMKLD